MDSDNTNSITFPLSSRLNALKTASLSWEVYLITFSPLLSAGFGRKDVVEHLLQTGANVHARDDGGLIPLHNACSFGHSEVRECGLWSASDCVYFYQELFNLSFSGTCLLPFHPVLHLGCSRGHRVFPQTANIPAWSLGSVSSIVRPSIHLFIHPSIHFLLTS